VSRVLSISGAMGGILGLASAAPVQVSSMCSSCRASLPCRVRRAAAARSSRGGASLPLPRAGARLVTVGAVRQPSPIATSFDDPAPLNPAVEVRVHVAGTQAAQDALCARAVIDRLT